MRQKGHALAQISGLGVQMAFWVQMMKNHRHEIDCPACKYGTLVRWYDKVKNVVMYRCIDCGKEYPEDHVKKPKK